MRSASRVKRRRSPASPSRAERKAARTFRDCREEFQAGPNFYLYVSSKSRLTYRCSIFLGGVCMKTVVELIKALTDLVFVIVLGLVVWGLLFR